MLGWSAILKQKPRDEAKLERGLEVIERNARAQEHLVNDLMDVSRIISGKLKLTLRLVEISAVVHAAAEVVRHAAEAKGVRLVVDLDPDVGANVGDPDRLQQVVWNLLSNAIRFTPRGGRILVTGQRSATGICIRVEDTGAGIPSEHLPYIFDRFRQVDSSTTRRHGGLGLGLAIVRHLVEAHGGSVDAKSDGPDRGATFTINLPIRAIVDETAVKESMPEEAKAPGTTATLGESRENLLRGVRVLVVDDDPDSLELLGVALGGAGAKVTAAHSAREALAAQGPFDVILSDIGMPEMDGYAFVRRVRSRDAGGDIPAIALTAYARVEDAERALRAGYQEHFAKPVDAGKLLEAVKLWSRARSASI
jgi:CheY-like chemotaxis protein/two-component sensor histidine kinase